MWATIIGGVVSALVSWYGINKQEQATKEAQKVAKDVDARDYALTASSKAQEFALRKKELGITAGQNAETMKYNKENRDFQLAGQTSDRLLSLINSQPQLQSLLTQRLSNQRTQAYDFKGLNPLGRNS